MKQCRSSCSLRQNSPSKKQSRMLNQASKLWSKLASSKVKDQRSSGRFHRWTLVKSLLSSGRWLLSWWSGQPQHAQCRFKSTRCHNCRKFGHISSVCKQAKRFEQNHQDKNCDEVYPTGRYCRGNLSHQRRTWEALAQTLNEKPPTLELDTGAAVSLVSEQTYQQQLVEVLLRSATVPLRTYSEELIEVKGCADVAVKYAGQQVILRTFVVKGEGPSLFGCNWLGVYLLGVGIHQPGEFSAFRTSLGKAQGNIPGWTWRVERV